MSEYDDNILWPTYEYDTTNTRVLLNFQISISYSVRIISDYVNFDIFNKIKNESLDKGSLRFRGHSLKVVRPN